MKTGGITIRVAVADSVYVGPDQGRHWKRIARESTPEGSTRYCGIALHHHTPFENAKVHWDFIHLSAGGFGAAVNHQKSSDHPGEAAGNFLAKVFISHDHALHWRENPLRLGFFDRIRSSLSWPAERFHSLIVTTDNKIILAWEDPWIMERSKSHVIFSFDHGSSWHYRRLGAFNGHLYSSGDGRLVCFSRGKRMASFEYGNHWRKDKVELAIDVVQGDAIFSDIQQVRLVSAREAYALLAQFNPSVMTRPEKILLLNTHDGGLRWHQVTKFDFPRESPLGSPGSTIALDVSTVPAGDRGEATLRLERARR